MPRIETACASLAEYAKSLGTVCVVINAAGTRPHMSDGEAIPNRRVQKIKRSTHSPVPASNRDGVYDKRGFAAIGGTSREAAKLFYTNEKIMGNGIISSRRRTLSALVCLAVSLPVFDE